MKFHTLDVQNFLTLKSAKVELADRGLHLIQGVNDDDSSATSNGAGKSSLVDAICWCLFGVTARDVKGDAVVNLGAKKDCRVSLVISNGHTRYRVIRHRKHATFKNSLILEVASADPSEVPTDLSRGTDAETQKVLEKVIGCSYEVFMAAVYSGQEVMPDLPKMKDRELKTLIEEAAGLQRIERAYELARERANTAKNAGFAARLKLDTALTQQLSGEQDLVAVEEQQTEWEAGRTVRVAASTALLDKQKNSEAVIVTSIKDFSPAAEAAKLRIAEIDVRLSSHKTLEDAALKASQLVVTVERSIDAGAFKRLVADVKLYEAKIANAAEEIKKPCTQCGTVLESMPIEDFIAHAQRHLDEARKRQAEATVTLKVKVEELNAARSKAAELRDAVPDVSALITERKTCVAQVERLDAMLSQHKTAISAVKDAQVQLDVRASEKNPHDAVLAHQRTKLSDIVARIAVEQTTCDTFENAAKIAAAVVKVFGPAGVRAQILDTVTPFLNSRTADYLTVLSDGEIQATWTTLTKSAAGELKEKFSLDVTHAKGGDSFLALSGGEKRKVRLATALALQDLVASRATQPIDLFIGDEVDDALDPAGLERLMTILERKARERGTVLVISHSDLRDWVDDVTIVRKSGLWSSNVEGSLCS